MKVRIISAILALIIFIPLLILGGIYLKIGATILGVLALKEALDIKKDLPKLIKIISYILISLLIFFEINITIKILIILFIFSIFLIIYDNKIYNVEDMFYLTWFSIVISLLFTYIYLIREKDFNVLIYLFLITIFTDTFAYISGKLFGRHKLNEKISPNKTKEGSIIGSLIGTILPAIFYIYMISPGDNFIVVILFTLVLSIIGQIGDLVFSSIKRKYNKKDFSNIMPGHGGILDRFDSITFVIIGYIILINFL